eukprot:PhM_4_TR2044/c0_g1_i1/m.64461/K18442/ARFGEF, BIG; brefeldin A-inhibited guanine nucleotide-exchange protein
MSRLQQNSQLADFLSTQLQKLEKRIPSSQTNEPKFLTLRNVVSAVAEHVHGKPSPLVVSDSTEIGFLLAPFRLGCCLTEDAGCIQAAVEALEQFLAHGFLCEKDAVYDSPDLTSLAAQKKGFLTDLFSRGRSNAASSQQHRNNSKNNALGGAPTSAELPPDVLAQIISWIGHNAAVPNDNVQGATARSLRTALSAPNVNLHGATFLTAFRIAFSVFSSTTSEVVRNSAKTTLTLFASAAYQRVESDLSNSKGTCVQRRLHATSMKASERTHHRSTSITGGGGPSSPTSSSSPAATDAERAPTPPTTTSEQQHVDPTTVRRYRAASTVSVAVPSAGTLGKPSAAVQSFCEELVEYSDDVEEELRSFPSETQCDAFLLLRGLCRLSLRQLSASDAKLVKENNKEAVAKVALDVRCKRLSLELILNIVGHSDDVLVTHPQFISHGVRKHVCQAVLENCLSTHTEVSKVAFHVFWVLISKYRDVLKKEIGVMISTGVVSQLQSRSTTYNQKEAVLGLVTRMAEDPQLLCDIFVNYDCDISQENVYESLIACLSKITTSSHVIPNWFSAHEERLLIASSVGVLTSNLKSIVGWMWKFEEQQLQQQQDEEAAENGSVCQNNINGAESSTPLLTVVGSGNVSLEPKNPHAASTSFNSAATTTTTTSRSCEEEEEDEFTREKRIKRQTAEALDMFPSAPKKAMKYLYDANVLPREPHIVAQWLRTTKGLDKVALGELLGGSDEFAKSVLHEYVELFDFHGLQIDEALRLFMSTFKICGEAQVIDRTVLLMAAKFCADNDGVTPFTPDGAYIMSFSIMMLGTDLHNPAIAKKDRMTREQFCRNFRDVEDLSTIPDSTAVFEGIYERIAANAITLADDESGISNSNDRGSSPPPDSPTSTSSRGRKKSTRQLRQEAEAERSSLLDLTRQLFRHSGEERDSSVVGVLSSSYYFADRVQHIRPMWETTSACMLVAYSTVFDGLDMEDAKCACLEGIEKGVHISCMTGLRSVRNAYIATLYRMTILEHYPRASIAPKNAKAIRTLLTVAAVDGDHLRVSWKEVMSCIAALQRHHFISAEIGAVVSDAQQHNRCKDILRAENVDEQLTERVFALSMELSGEAIVYFIEHLCKMARTEVDGGNPPRLFGLQKVLEVAEVNMHRIQLVWTQMWTHIGDLLTYCALHPHIRVAMHAIDSLRQLAVKFMEREEFTSFHFQREFLKPFEIVFASARPVEIKELILRCLIQLIQLRGTRIMSGWKSILICLSRAASDSAPIVMTSSFEAVEVIVSTCVHYLATPEHFADLVSCMIAFAFNDHNELIARKGLLYLEVFARFLLHGIPMPSHPVILKRKDTIRDSTCTRANEPISSLEMLLTMPLDEDDASRENLIHVLPRSPSGVPMSLSNKVELRLWLAIYTGFCTLATSNPRIPVRITALRQLFRSLRCVGDYFSAEVWGVVFTGAVFPLFDNVFCEVPIPSGTHPVAAEKDWQIDAIGTALESLLQWYTYQSELLRPLFADILQATCVACIRRHEDMYTYVSLRTLETFLDNGAANLIDEDWAILTSSIGGLMKALLPNGITHVTPQVDADGRGHLVVPVRRKASSVVEPHAMYETPAGKQQQQPQEVTPLPVANYLARLNTLQKVVNSWYTICTHHAAHHEGLLVEAIERTNDIVNVGFDVTLSPARSKLIRQQCPQLHTAVWGLASNVITSFLEIIVAQQKESELAKTAMKDFVAAVLEHWLRLSTAGEAYALEDRARIQDVVTSILDFILEIDDDDASFEEWFVWLYRAYCSMIGVAEPMVSARLCRIFLRAGAGDKRLRSQNGGGGDNNDGDDGGDAGMYATPQRGRSSSFGPSPTRRVVAALTKVSSVNMTPTTDEMTVPPQSSRNSVTFGRNNDEINNDDDADDGTNEK